jgi:hypothetical protein
VIEAGAFPCSVSAPPVPAISRQSCRLLPYGNDLLMKRAVHSPRVAMTSAYRATAAATNAQSLRPWTRAS